MASKVAEAAEVNEAAEVSEAWKITTEDFRVIHAFEFSFIFIWGRIMKYHIEFKHLFCRRLLRPVNITFLKTDGRNSNVHTS